MQDVTATTPAPTIGELVELAARLDAISVLAVVDIDGTPDIDDELRLTAELAVKVATWSCVLVGNLRGHIEARLADDEILG